MHVDFSSCALALNDATFGGFRWDLGRVPPFDLGRAGSSHWSGTGGTLTGVERGEREGRWGTGLHAELETSKTVYKYYFQKHNI